MKKLTDLEVALKLEEIEREEVIKILNEYDNHIQENFDPSKTILSTKEWFEQFKKK